MTEFLKGAIRRYAGSRVDAEGVVTTSTEGVGMMISYAPTGLMHAIYKPVLCLVFGGAKQLTVANEVQVVSAGQSVIITADVPVIGRVVSATRSEPYLAFALALDMGVVRDVAAQFPPMVEQPARSPMILMSDDTDEALLDGAGRLLRLLEHPDAAPVLSPAIIREMHYWLLAGQHGDAIRRLAMLDSHAERIARAVAVLRAEFARTVPVERLAATAGMSASSFHQHFKTVTSLSPRQFQKQLRLLEARRLMFSEGRRASAAAFEVGYESVSQFTREYGRMFGAPPRKDRDDARAAA